MTLVRMKVMLVNIEWKVCGDDADEGRMEVI